MKKINLLIVAALVLSFSNVNAYNIDLLGPVIDSGTGFGAVSNILSLQTIGGGTTEEGSIGWNGSDVAIAISGQVKNSSQTWLFSEIAAKGMTDASQLGIVFNVNQKGSEGGLSLYLDNFQLLVYTVGGAPVGGPVATSTGFGQDYFAIDQGTGGSGYLFDPTGELETWLQTFFLNPDQYRLGMSAKVDEANDGQDNFFFAKISGTTPVPEPATLVLIGVGLIGLAGYGRKKLT